MTETRLAPSMLIFVGLAAVVAADGVVLKITMTPTTPATPTLSSATTRLPDKSIVDDVQDKRVRWRSVTFTLKGGQGGAAAGASGVSGSGGEMVLSAGRGGVGHPRKTR